jgi:hypothetical protein
MMERHIQFRSAQRPPATGPRSRLARETDAAIACFAGVVEGHESGRVRAPTSDMHASVLSGAGRRREEVAARAVGTAAAPELPIRRRLRLRLRHEFAGRQAIAGCRSTRLDLQTLRLGSFWPK